MPSLADLGAAYGTGSPAEEAQKPSGLAALFSAAYHGVGGIAKRAVGNSLSALETGYYNPAPVMEAATAVMGGGMPMAERGALGMAGGRLQAAPQIKVVKTGKDTFNIVDHEGKVLANADIGVVTIGGKRLAQIDDINTPALNNVTTQAEHEAAVQAGRNALGTGHMREAMRQFLEMHPDVEGFTGNRVSGARNAGAMDAGNIQNITVGVQR